jgi:hypothetical protein
MAITPATLPPQFKFFPESGQAGKEEVLAIVSINMFCR